MGNLVDYAKSELALIKHDEQGIQDEIDKCILELLEVFSNQGHTNNTGNYCLRLFNRLVQFKPITPLTDEDDEWEELRLNSDTLCNKRCAYIMKNKNTGETYNINGKAFSDDGMTWYMNKDSRVPIEFPYTVPDKPEKVVITHDEI